MCWNLITEATLAHSMANGCGHNMPGGPGSAVVCRFLEVWCACVNKQRMAG